MRTTNQLAAEKILIAHQATFTSACICGWGQSPRELGLSHAAHVVDVLTAAGLIAEPAAVDREALAEWLYTELEWQGETENHWSSLRSQDVYRWRAIAGQLLEHWGILDAAAVRHEHGERIAVMLDEEVEPDQPADVGAAYQRSAKIVREFSPAPPREG